jgi:hypothetical protein
VRQRTVFSEQKAVGKIKRVLLSNSRLKRVRAGRWTLVLEPTPCQNDRGSGDPRVALGLGQIGSGSYQQTGSLRA